MLAGLAPFIYKISTWTPKISFSCDILWSAHHMEREFGEEGQWQRLEQRERMQGWGRARQMMGCVGRGVWLVFKTRQMEGCLRPKGTVKDHQEKSNKRFHVLNYGYARNIICIWAGVEIFNRRQSTGGKDSGAFVYSFNSYWKGDILGEIPGGRLTAWAKSVMGIELGVPAWGEGGHLFERLWYQARIL